VRALIRTGRLLAESPDAPDFDLPVQWTDVKVDAKRRLKQDADIDDAGLTGMLGIGRQKVFDFPNGRENGIFVD
jgi:hypothetical protein